MIVTSFCSSSSSTITLRPRLSIQRTTPACSRAGAVSHCCAASAATTSAAAAAPSGRSQPTRRGVTRSPRRGLAPGIRSRQPQGDTIPQLRSGRRRRVLAQEQTQLGQPPQLPLQLGGTRQAALERQRVRPRSSPSW